MSPAFYTLHPVAALLFPDCGIGSDPNAGGPCTGSYGPEHLGESVTGVLSSGKGEVLAVGAALLAMFAVVVLLNMIRRPLKQAKAQDDPVADAVDDEAPVCQRCGATVDDEEAELLCADCFAADLADARASGAFDEPPADAGVCSVCGVASEELVGDLFPACPECAAASEADARRREVDDGPDDVDTFDGNPNGVGGGGVRA